MTEKPKKKRSGQFDATGRWVIVATVSASSMAFIMQSALNVAIPPIQDDLGATGADVVWIVNAFPLLLSALILLGGALGDLYGRKRVYLLGILIFTGACIAGGLATSTELLIAARAAQGIGGALMVPGSLAIISAYFDDKTRGLAIGTWSTFTTAASILAPVGGGFLADAGLWRAIFFICIPLALLSIYALLTHVPESRDEEMPQVLDIPGAVLITLSLGGIIYGATELGRSGTTNIVENPIPLVTIGIGLVAMVVFFFVERNSDHPLVPLRLFKSRTFLGANLMTLFLYGALAGALFFMPLNLQQIQGYSATVSGLATLPVTIGIMALSPFMGRLVDRAGPRLPMTLGPLIVGAGFLALALPGVTAGAADYWLTFFPGLVILGIGMGFVVAPLTTAALGSVPQRNSGVASGINNFMSRASGALTQAILGGIALIVFASTLQASVMSMEIPSEAETQLMQNAEDFGNTTVPQSLGDEMGSQVSSAIDWAFVQTFRLMMVIAAGLCFLSAGLAGALVQKELKPPAELLNQPVSTT
ncbi:MAG: MFS transporter [Anaerolineae bacterium]|nr:MFS transporter [Anaerolineae bacterium]